MKGRVARRVVAGIVASVGLVGLIGAAVWFRATHPEQTAPLVVVVALAIFCLAAITVWLVPRRQVKRWREDGITGKDLAELGNATRTTLIQAIGGFALIATVALTAFQANEPRRSSDRNLEVAQQAQAADLLSRAIEQLGATTAEGRPALDVRIGALYSLARVAYSPIQDPFGLDRDLEDFRVGFIVPHTAGYQVAQILQSYIRVNLGKRDPGAAPPPHHNPCSAEAQRSRRPLREDIDAAFGIIGELRRSGQDFGAMDQGGLHGLDLSGYALRNTQFATVLALEETVPGVDPNLSLAGASLRNADLSGINFGSTSIHAADIRGACLRGAYLQDVNVSEDQRADLRGADTRRSSLGDRERFVIDETTKQ